MANVGHGNAVLPGAGGVDVVRARRRQCDQPEIRRGIEQLARQADLVGEDNVRAGDPVRDGIARRLVVDDQFIDEALEFPQVQAGAHGPEVKKYGLHAKLGYPLAEPRR